MHEQYELNPVYFFLVAGKNRLYDKNIPPATKPMQQLILDHSGKYSIGLHPSWQSGDDFSLLQKEKNTLENISGKAITKSRQHYLRFNLPAGYRRLSEVGLTEDYSMGYGSVNGFRASVASSFYWYDLEKEETTSLKLIPFCYMDANSFYEQKQTAFDSLQEMSRYYREIKKVNGEFVMIWHNTFLGTDERFAGWRDAYAQFVRELKKQS